MKICILFTCLLAFGYALNIKQGLEKKFDCIKKVITYQSRIFEKEIREKIEELRNKLKEGIPDLGIPPLDPLVVEEERVQVDSPFQLDFNISQRTDGILGFEITNLEVQLIGLKFDFTVNWPTLISHAKYGLDLTIENKNVFGNGNIDTSIKNFVITGSGNLVNKMVDGKLRILLDSLTIDLSLDEFNFQITGLMNDEEFSKIFSKLVTDAAPLAIEEAEVQINDGMAELIKIINDWIIKNTFKAIFNSLLLC